MNQLNAVSEYVGTYYSIEWVRKHVLKQTEEEMEQIDKQIEDEKSSGQVDPNAGMDMGGPDGGFGDPSYEEEPEEDDDE
jgi:hypothetical protein